MHKNKLSEQHTIELLTNLELMSVYTLINQKNCAYDPESISQKMNISVESAESNLQKLIEMKLIDSNFTCELTTLHFDDTVVSSNLMISAQIQMNQRILAKFTNKNTFHIRFELMNKKIIQKYMPEFDQLINDMVEESKNEPDAEVHVMSFTFNQASFPLK